MSGRRYFMIPLLLALLSFPACSVHRQQAVEPPGQVPEAYVEKTRPDIDELPIGRWWEAFGDDTLSALMDEAFSGNLGLLQAYAIFDQLEAISRQAAAPRYPFLNADADAGRSRQPGIFGEDTGNSYSLSLAAGYEVDLWNKYKSGARAADLEADASLQEIETFYMSLSARLADLYYLAVEQRAQIDLTDGTIASFEDTLDRVTRRYTLGLVPALDVYQARQNLSFAKASRPLFESALAQAEHAIAVLLGRYPGKGLSGDLAKLPETPAAFPVGIPSRLLTMRPDIRSAFLRVEASDARVAAAIADRFPSINLLGSYGTSKTAFSAGDISGVFWNVLVGLTQPIIDGGSRRAEVDRSEAEFLENLARYQETVLTSVREVEDALAANRTTEERIKGLEERVEATGRALRLSLDRYVLGLSDYLPVLTAQTLHFTARSQLLAERRQLISDRISLARALGGNWMEEEVKQGFEALKEGGGGR